MGDKILSLQVLMKLQVSGERCSVGGSHSERGQRVFHGGPSKQKPAPIFVLVD
jgi:hypothetical protein